MKLELKHLAPYLPYDLKCMYTHTKEIGEIKSLYDIERYDDIKLRINYLDGEHIWMFKPILRPISDLTKEIEHNGERFVPIVELAKKISFYDIETIESYSKSEAVIHFIDSKGFKRGVDIIFSPEGYLQYNFYTREEKSATDWSSLRIDHLSVTNKLLEWHFDVFGLIDAGLAIDINTLNN